MKLAIHTDGGSRGNPGPAGIGVVVEHDTTELATHKAYIGKKTNNEAEYEAVVQALTLVLNQKDSWGTIDSIAIYLDSLLVCNQLKGLYKVKQAHLAQIVLSVRQLEQELGVPIDYTHVPREENKHADKLVNEALDDHLGLSK